MTNYYNMMTLEERKQAVRDMDEAVRNFDDEENIEVWLMYGVPDHCDEIDEDDVEWFAEDEEEFNDLIKLYKRLKKYEEEA